MATEKIVIKSIKFVRDFANVITTDGREMSANTTYAGCEVIKGWKEGEEKEISLTEKNGKLYFGIPKAQGAGKTFAVKDETWQKRKAALDNTVALVVAGKVPMEKLTECRDKFYEYITLK